MIFSTCKPTKKYNTKKLFKFYYKLKTGSSYKNLGIFKPLFVTFGEKIIAMNNSILGMGNALTDILVFPPDNSLIDKFSLEKGGMQHVDLQTAQKIWRELEVYPKRLVPGGCSANTVSVTAALGMRSGFIGKVGRDEIGDIFEKGLLDAGVAANILRGEAPSGRATVFVNSANGERTFATYLGAAKEFEPQELQETFFEGYRYFIIEGYLAQNYELLRKAVEIAKGRGMIICLDLASYNVVGRNSAFLMDVVRDYVDILFANELEAKIFTGEEPLKAVEILADLCSEAVVKLGANGSLVRGEGVTHKIEPYPAKVVDTTGAGDVYAAGFLYAHSMGRSLQACGEAGSFVASMVVAEVGPKIKKTLLADLKGELDALLGIKVKSL